MKLNKYELLAGKNISDATLDWELHAVSDSSNKALELDAYGIYVLEALDNDVCVKEFASQGDISGATIDGYGVVVKKDLEPKVIVGQWGYGDAMHLGARARDGAAKLRVLKIGKR